MDQLPQDEPYKFGIQYEPPALVYIYRDKYVRKLTRYMISLQNFNIHSDYKTAAIDIKERYDDKLQPISQERIEDSLRRLLKHMKNGGKITKNRRLHYIGPKINLPVDPLFQKIQINEDSDGHSVTTDIHEEHDVSS